jgi:Bifunctional DNA primase/polymerase, N-terminal
MNNTDRPLGAQITSAIADAARSADVYAAALAYTDLGLSVLPCKGKEPSIFWKPFQNRRASPQIIANWYHSGFLHNVGIICGSVSANLVVLDLDGMLAINLVNDVFPGLSDTYRVMTGSGQGNHYYFYTEEPTPTTRVMGTPWGNIELRSDKTYVIAPPSIHPFTGRPYVASYAREIERVHDLREVVEWIKSLMRNKHDGQLPPPAGKVYHNTAYGLAALHSESQEVAQAIPGERNNRLYRAALKLGSLIADGKLTRSTVERELLGAASSLSQNDGEAATLHTIASGINRGLESSRDRYKRA